MEGIQELKETELGQIKAQTEDEFLTKIGAKDHEIEIDPLIVNEPMRRSSSFVCSSYHKPPIYRQKPKIVQLDTWKCKSQACRQLSMVPRFGPRKFYINNQNIHEKTTQYLRYDVKFRTRQHKLSDCVISRKWLKVYDVNGSSRGEGGFDICWTFW